MTVDNPGREMQMSIAGREMLIVVCALFLLVTAMENPSTAVAATAEKTTKGAAVGQADRFGKPQAAFDVSKMGDMSDFDPAIRLYLMVIRSESRLLPHFQGRGQATDSSIGPVYSGPRTTSISGVASWWTAKGNLSRCSKPIIWVSPISAKRFAKGWSYRKRSMHCGAPMEAT